MHKKDKNIKFYSHLEIRGSSQTHNLFAQAYQFFFIQVVILWLYTNIDDIYRNIQLEEIDSNLNDLLLR